MQAPIHTVMVMVVVVNTRLDDNEDLNARLTVLSAPELTYKKFSIQLKVSPLV